MITIMTTAVKVVITAYLVKNYSGTDCRSSSSAMYINSCVYRCNNEYSTEGFCNNILKKKKINMNIFSIMTYPGCKKP